MSLPVHVFTERYLAQIAPGDNAGFVRILNEAEERLMETGRWHWCKALVTLVVEDGGRVRLDPSVHRAILGCTVDNGATVIQTRELEFLPGGPGREDPAAGNAGYLIDEGIVVVPDNEGSDSGEDGGVVLRRSYKIMPVVEDGDTVEALVHLAHPELSTDSPDNTTCACPSSGALKLAMLAVVYEEANDFVRSQDYWQRAHALLDGDEKTNRGGARATPSVQPFGPGISPVPNLI